MKNIWFHVSMNIRKFREEYIKDIWMSKSNFHRKVNHSPNLLNKILQSAVDIIIED